MRTTCAAAIEGEKEKNILGRHCRSAYIIALIYCYVYEGSFLFLLFVFIFLLQYFILLWVYIVLLGNLFSQQILFYAANLVAQ